MKRSSVYVIIILTIIVSVFAFNFDNSKISYSNTFNVIEEHHMCASTGGYAMHFNSNGGSSVPDTGAILIKLPDNMPAPTRSGYIFKGWYADQALTRKVNKVDDLIMYYVYDSYGCPSTETTVYAKWEKDEPDTCIQSEFWILYFDTAGGSYIKDQRRDSRYDTFDFPTPTKSGFKFAGWYKDSSYQTVAHSNIDGINFMRAQNSGCSYYVGTVYAKWVEIKNNNSSGGGGSKPPKEDSVKPVCPNVINKLHIGFNTDGGTEIDDIDICLTCDAEEITLPQPEKEGKNFVGWYSDENLENQVIVDGLNTEVQITQFKISVETLPNGCSSDIASTTLYARYEDIVCKTPDIAYLDINFVTGDETDRIEDVKKCLDCDEEYYELPILEKDDYIFGGWYIDADYSQLISKKINLSNAIKYLNVTRDFENNCSTDTLSTILYARWIPLSEVKNVRLVFLANGNIVGDKIYGINSPISDLPEVKEKGLKLDGWYTDSSYTKEFTKIDDLLKDSYGVDYRSGQIFLYVYGKMSEDKSLDTSKIIIIFIVIAVAVGIAYIVINEGKANKRGKKVTWHT